MGFVVVCQSPHFIFDCRKELNTLKPRMDEPTRVSPSLVAERLCPYVLAPAAQGDAGRNPLRGVAGGAALGDRPIVPAPQPFSCRDRLVGV